MRRYGAAVSLVLILGGLPWGCARRAAASADGERQVRNAIDQFYARAAVRDWDGAGALLADDFVMFTDGAAHLDRTAYVALMKQDDLVLERMALHDMRVEVSPDGQMAWGTFRGSFEMTSGGRRHDVSTVETLIFRRASGRWQIVRAHASTKDEAHR